MAGKTGNGKSEVVIIDPPKPAPLALSADVLSLLPDIQTMAPLERELYASPYVQFMDTRAKNFADVVGKIGAVPSGTPVLIIPDGRMYRCDNMQFWLTPFRFQHWSVLDDKNKTLQAVLESDKIPNDGKRWNEFVETVGIVMTHDGPIPARIGFKTVKTPAAHEVYTSMQECTSNPQKWASASVDHAAAINIPQVWLRLHGVIHLKQGKGDFEYMQANATIKPTGAGQFATIVAMLNSEDGKKLLQLCIDGHKERELEIKAKCI